MAVDTATHIGGFDTTLPNDTTDTFDEGDDNFRHIKLVLKTDFGAITGAVTATHAELNILDGVTATTAELNILDGVTSTATELNLLDGITAVDTDDTLAADSDTVLPSQSAVKGYVDTQIAAIGGGMNAIQTGYKLISSWTSGSGEDTNYDDIALSPNVVAANCVVILHAENGTANDAYPITGRVTAVDNLRIACAGAPGTIAVRWYVLEYSL